MPSFVTIDGEEWIATTFSPTPVMSTYLLAFTVSDFSKKQDYVRAKITVCLFHLELNPESDCVVLKSIHSRM